MKSPSKSLSARRARATAVLEIMAKAEPAPKTELYFHTPFQLLVSVVLSAQTTDKSVNRCMQAPYDAGLGPQTIIDWGPERLLEQIRTIGLAPTKAKNVAALAQLIRDRHHGDIPRTREELLALPGVGTKTASVVLAELYGEATLAVDTHVYRVSQRLGLQQENSAAKAEQELLKVIDKRFLPAAHHWLILHGRYTCKALRPLCTACVVRDLCPSVMVADKTKARKKLTPV